MEQASVNGNFLRTHRQLHGICAPQVAHGDFERVSGEQVLKEFAGAQQNSSARKVPNICAKKININLRVFY